jgi:hypothetical protein
VTPSRYFFSQSPAIRGEGDLSHLCKDMVALERAACHHAPMNIYESNSCDRHCYAAIQMVPPSARCGQDDQFRQNAPM